MSMDELRKGFEDIFSGHGSWNRAIEKDDNGNYKLATAYSAWEEWKLAYMYILQRLNKND
jgi:hypothetical protein